MIDHSLGLFYDILQCNKWTKSKIKLLPHIDVSNETWYLIYSDATSSSITSSALSFILNSMLSHFECITRSQASAKKRL